MTPVSTPSTHFQPPARVFNPHHAFLTPHHLFCTLGTRICVFLGFSLFLCTPRTRRRVFPGLVFYFIYFLFFPCTRNMVYHVSGAFFCSFSFFAPPGHAYVCFGGLFLSLHPRTRIICMFAEVFSSFLFFVLLCTPATCFNQQTRVTNPQTHVSNPQQPVSATYNPNPHVLTIYNSQPCVHWHPRP